MKISNMKTRVTKNSAQNTFEASFLKQEKKIDFHKNLTSDFLQSY